MLCTLDAPSKEKHSIMYRQPHGLMGMIGRDIKMTNVSASTCVCFVFFLFAAEQSGSKETSFSQLCAHTNVAWKIVPEAKVSQSFTASCVSLQWGSVAAHSVTNPGVRVCVHTVNTYPMKHNEAEAGQEEHSQHICLTSANCSQ